LGTASAALLGLFAAFAGLTATVQLGWWRSLDVALIVPVAIGSPCTLLQAGWLLSPLFSAEVSVVLAAVLAAAVYWRTRRWSAAWLLVGLLATAPLEYASKQLVRQPVPKATPPVSTVGRPNCGKESYPLTQVATPFSYPSGSVTRLVYFGTLAGAATWSLPRGRGGGSVRLAALAAIVLFVAFAAATRVVIRWHWPSDVLGGFLLGTACACAVLLRFRLPARAYSASSASPSSSAVATTRSAPAASRASGG
jgi:membrane-associated phospholipid phosphatase